MAARKFTPYGGGVAMSIQVGQTAPDFTLKTNKMQDFALSEAKGKKNTVILFVPFAFTGG